MYCFTNLVTVNVANTISLHQCTSCEYSTMNKYYLKQHIKRQHVWSGTTNFVCNKCYVRKPNEYLLKKHMQQHIHLKDVKNVGNGLAVRKSSDHTHKSTRRIKRWRRRRLTYSASMYLSWSRSRRCSRCNKNSLDFSHIRVGWLDRYFGHYCSLVYPTTRIPNSSSSSSVTKNVTKNPQPRYLAWKSP